MKKILLVGSTGRVGGKVKEYVLKENKHKLRVLVRNPDILENEKDLEIVKGDIKNFEEVKKACEGVDIIISTLSGRKTKPDYSVLSEGIKNLIMAMKENSIKRIINLGGSGILKDKDFGLRRNKPGYPQIFKNVSSENLKVESLLIESNLDWTFVCAPEMPYGELTKKFRTEVNYLPGNGSRISVEDVAFYLCQILE
ncbi:MAG: NAD(P)H-binding protein, partial [Leptospiraceae bacterium]|nr:NAD(P)H-binding protein [Leptospiraceae bacterium]